MKIKIKYLTDILPLEQHGNWIDLRCSETTMIGKDEHKLIPLGVAIELPENYEAQIVPRSSTYKNFGLIQVNSPGIVDSTYRGNKDQWFFSAYSLRGDVVIHKNDRICQFRIFEKQPNIEFEIVENLESNNRGGFGSSGIN